MNGEVVIPFVTPVTWTAKDQAELEALAARKNRFERQLETDLEEALHQAIGWREEDVCRELLGSKDLARLIEVLTRIQIANTP